MTPVQFNTQTTVVYIVCVGLAMVVISVAFTVGQFPISFGELLSILHTKLFGGPSNAPINADVVLFDIRAPRIVGAFMVGCALAAAGAAYQNLFRNPLVSPDILGVSSGAALGAVLGIFLMLPLFAIQAMAFVGGLIAVAAIYLIGARIRIEKKTEDFAAEVMAQVKK